jgi:arsenate reductase
MIKLLFICTHNACRSILAEVIVRDRAGDHVMTASAGSAPSGRIHPLTIEHLTRHGYPTTGLVSGGYEDVGDFKPDVVITVCDRAAGEACPLWLDATPKVHWGLPDPSHLEGTEEERTAAFDSVIATLETRAEALAQTLPLPSGPVGLKAILDKIAIST